MAAMRLLACVLLGLVLAISATGSAWAQDPPGRGGGGGSSGRADPTPDTPRSAPPRSSTSRTGGGDDDRTGSSSSSPEDIRRAGLSVDDVVMARRDRPEYILVGTAQETGAAFTALVTAGAQGLRARDYPGLDRRAIFLSLGSGLTLAEARTITAQAAPAAEIDLHTVYRFAQGSTRLYAAALLGDTGHGRCRIERPVRIGVIDGPVNPAHSALRDVTLIRDSVLDRGDRVPPDRHGTSVVALIAGEDPDGQITGFARGAEIHAISAFTQVRGREAADLERISAAIDRLVSRDVRLMNMSFAGPPNRAFENVLQAAANRRAVMIAAVGNRALDYPAYPAASPQVIGVTALDAAQRRYRRANTGAQVEFAAPGVDVYTARGRGGGYVTGTSFAAPIVTALAARLDAGGQASTDDVRRSFRTGAIDLGSPGRDTGFGWGLVRAPDC